MSVAVSDGDTSGAKYSLKVRLDGAQYRMDMLKLAVEDSMFVEESYSAC